MNSIGERIKYLRTVNDVTMKQLSAATGLNQGGLSSYENNKFKPSAEAIVLISNFFKVSTDWILKGDRFEIETDLSNQEREFLKLYNTLNRENQLKIIGMIELKIKEQEEQREPLYPVKDVTYPYAAEEGTEYMRPIAILGNVAAGEPIEAIYSPDDFLMLTGTSKASFALKIRGDSMEPQIKDGSTVLVEKNSDIQNGKVAIVDIAGDVTCKKIIVANDHVELHSFNSKYNPIILTRDEVEEKGVHVIGYVLLDKDLGN